MQLMTIEDEIRAALAAREAAERLINEEERDPKDTVPAAVRAAKGIRREANKLLAVLYERDRRWQRRGR